MGQWVTGIDPLTHMSHSKMVTHLTHDPLTHFHLCYQSTTYMFKSHAELLLPTKSCIRRKFIAVIAQEKRDRQYNYKCYKTVSWDIYQCRPIRDRDMTSGQTDRIAAAYCTVSVFRSVYSVALWKWTHHHATMLCGISRADCNSFI